MIVVCAKSKAEVARKRMVGVAAVETSRVVDLVDKLGWWWLKFEA